MTIIDVDKRIVSSVSIALCTYNGEKYIREQLDSILRQTYPIEEIIVVEDCSSDSTLSILREYEEKYPILKILVNDKNMGFLYSFSKAIQSATGEYVALCDQDDIWTDNHVQILLDSIGEKQMAIGNSLLVDCNGRSMNKTIFEVKDVKFIPTSDIEKVYRILYFNNPYQGCNMLARRSWLFRLLPMPLGAKYHDVFFAIAACLTGGMVVTNRVVNYYRQHPMQYTNNARIPIYKELHCRRHFSYWRDREVYIEAIRQRFQNLSKESTYCIEEFIRYSEYEKNGQRWAMFNIRRKHYREIYTTRYYKYFFLRSAHFLLSK